MMRANRSKSRASLAATSFMGVLATLVLATSVANAMNNAMSDDKEKYDPLEAGHPLRIAAYVLHPVGVIIDRLILRPAYWLGSHEPIKTLVGRTD
jgi:hypothetical protein